VSEVASIGGFEKTYQITVDPSRLQAYGIPITRVMSAVQASNQDVGAMMMELSEREYMIRGLGYLEGITDIENVVVGSTARGTPIRVADVANVELAPDVRRGVADLDGRGDVVGGIVVMRFGENALATIDRVKERLAEIEPGLPEGITITPVYDRSSLILDAISTLRQKLTEELLIVALISLLFLFHARSALVAVLTLPIGVLMAFIAMRALGLGADIMSLGGIAIAIGVMIDAAIVMIENMHKHLERTVAEKQDAARARGEPVPDDDRLHTGILTSQERWQVVVDSSKEVGPALFFSLLIITVSFFPVFALEAQEGRMFKPLAWTKTLAMAAASLLAITLVPVAMGLFVRGRIHREDTNPISRGLRRVYRPALEWVLDRRWPVDRRRRGRPHPLLHPLQPDRQRVHAAPQRGEHPLHAHHAPRRERGHRPGDAHQAGQHPGVVPGGGERLREGRAGHHGHGPGAAGHVRDHHRAEAGERMARRDDAREAGRGDGRGAGLPRHHELLDHAHRRPDRHAGHGDPHARGREGVRARPPRAGPDRKEVEEAAAMVPGTRSAFAERAVSGYYLDVDIDRVAAARYGLNVQDIQMVLASAVGGMQITETVEGRERYGVRLRYPQELRDQPEKLAELLIPVGAARRGRRLGGCRRGRDGRAGRDGMAAAAWRRGWRRVAPRRSRWARWPRSAGPAGPMVIKTEGAFPTAWVFLDVVGRDIGGYVADAKAMVDEMVTLPPGYTLQWSGQYEYMERAKEKLQYVVPATLLIIFLLLYLNFRSVGETMIVMLSLPFALVGGVLFMWLLGYNWSVATVIGFIALAGVAAETGVVMLIYLDMAWKERVRAGGPSPPRPLRRHHARRRGAGPAEDDDGGRHHRRAAAHPLGHGTGASVMKRIAAPMVGGMVSSTILTLLVIPAVYSLWREWQLRRGTPRGELEPAVASGDPVEPIRAG
jgi:copper/silver efflux system protein